MTEKSDSLDSLSIQIERLRTEVRDTTSPSRLAELGQLLRRRATLTQSMADLDGAVRAFEAAAEMAVSRGSDVAPQLSNLSALLYERFTRRSDTGDLDRAIALASQAVAIADDSGSSHAEYLANYAAALYARFELVGAAEDIDAAVRISERALELADDRGRDAYLANLSTALQAKFAISGDNAVLDRAIEVALQAVAMTHVDDSARPARLYALGLALALRTTIHTSSEGLDQAMAPLVAVVRGASVGDDQRLAAAELAMFVAANHAAWSTALAIGDDVLRRIDETYSDADLMTRRALLASDASACAVRLNNVHRALEFFDAGRVRFWTRESLIRRDLSALRHAAPYLADSVIELNGRLKRSRLTESSANSWTHDRLWDVEISRVRALPGFEEFLREPALPSLTTSPGEVLIAVNVSRFGSDAILVEHNDVTTVSLPILTLQSALDKANAYLQHVLTDSSSAASRDREMQLIETLAWLWEALATPIVDALSLRDRARTSGLLNVRWCVSGPLGILPVHAAGLPRTSRNVGESLIELVNSSYVLSVRDAISRRVFPRSKLDADWKDKALVIAPSDLDAPLLSVPVEVSAVRETLREADALTGFEAQRDRMLNEMSGHTVVHFAGHGQWSPDETFKSGLRLADGVLTVDDLASGALGRTNLVVLLASCTALGDIRLTNEFISPAAAALSAGSSNVVATCLSIRDREATEFAAYFYRYLANSASALTQVSVSHATNEALRRLRAKYPDTPSAWAGIVHFAASPDAASKPV